MAWLRLTKVDGNMLLVNTDQVSEIRRVKDSSGDDFGAALWSYGEATGVHETVGEIAAMIADAEWRERVLRCACAIMSNEHANGLTSEQVWARAARFAAMEPERPGVN